MSVTIPLRKSFSDSRRDADEDVIPFNGEEIDLTELIRDTLIINEPSRVMSG